VQLSLDAFPVFPATSGYFAASWASVP